MKALAQVRYNGHRAFACMTFGDSPMLTIVTIDAEFLLEHAAPAGPANADVIELAKQAIRRGYDVTVPAPDYDNIEYDYTEGEFRELVNSTAPVACDVRGWPDVSNVSRALFPRARVVTYSECYGSDVRAYEERYALVLRDNGTVVEVRNNFGGYVTRVPLAFAEGLPDEWMEALAENEKRIEREIAKELAREQEEFEAKLRAAGLLK